MNMNEPFLLKPFPKDYLWGGNRLNEEFNKNINVYPLAETWECSTHPDGQSTFAGRGLGEILNEHPEYIGSHPNAVGGNLPVIVKFIDAKQKLSVQVHPDDEYAAREGQLGKTEMWYVLEADKGAEIIYGFNGKVTAVEVKRAAEAGVIENYLNKVPVKKGDVFFIEAGTVHALGAGCLVAEIQENSNLTYRIYDYDRTDRNGKKRSLHLNQALEVADFNVKSGYLQPMRVLKYRQGYAAEKLCRCKYFEVDRVLVNSYEASSPPLLKTSALSFNILLFIEGEGVLAYGEKELAVKKGDCVFVPADCVKINLRGSFCMLKINC